jgi:hypothetical protein
MTRIFFLCLALFLFPGGLQAQSLVINRFISSVDGGGGGGGATYLINQGFEGTGYDNSETWTEAAGTPNEDDTTSPSPIVGSQSLRLDGTSVTQRTDSPSYTATADVWVYLRLNPATLPSSGNNDFLAIRNGTTQLLSAQINASGVLRVNVGANSSPTVSTMSAGTSYHVWIHYVAGTGANAVGSVAFSTDGVKPTAGNAFTSMNTGTSTLSANNVRLTAVAANGGVFVMDRVLVDDASIGDNP